MKIYQILQRNLAVMGFTPIQQQNNNWKISYGQIIDIVLYSIEAIFIGRYTFYEASGIEDYMKSIFLFAVLFAITIAYISIIFKNDKIFNTIEFFEQELNHSM